MHCPTAQVRQTVALWNDDVRTVGWRPTNDEQHYSVPCADNESHPAKQQLAHAMIINIQVVSGSRSITLKSTTMY